MSESMVGGAAGEDLPKLQKRFLSGANWFYWIAGLSAVNSAIVFAGGEWNFIFGLGITQVIDAIAAGITEGAEGGMALAVRAVAFGMNAVIVIIFAAFGWCAGKRMAWAFVLGMVLYAFDGLLFLLVQEWLSLAFHAFALFAMSSGFSAMRKLRQSEPVYEVEYPEDWAYEEEYTDEPAAGLPVEG